MKRTKVMTALIAVALIISMIASVSMLSAAAQDVSDLNTTGDSAFSDIKTTYVVTLYWDDNDNAYGIRPDEVTAIITANNGEFGSEYICLNESNHWENVKSGLPMFYYKGSRTGTISYSYEIIDLPEEYDISIVQEGNWFKVTCSLNYDALLGDADNDNDVNIVDTVVIQRYDVKLPVNSINLLAADVNRDKSVDIIDATILQRYLAGIDCSKFGFVE